MEVWSNDGTETTGWNNAIGTRNVGQMVLGLTGYLAVAFVIGYILYPREVRSLMKGK